MKRSARKISVEEAIYKRQSDPLPDHQQEHQDLSQNSLCQSGRSRSQSESSVTTTSSAACENAAEELIITEIHYLRRLHLLHHHYYHRLIGNLPQNSAVAAQFEGVFNKLFGTFYKKHRKLLTKLQTAVSNRNPSLGRLMLEFGKKSLVLYSEYYINSKGYIGLVSHCLKCYSAFRTACQAAKAECPDPRDRKLEVTSHMIEPVQRPLRYPLILNAYMKQIGPSHPDFEDAFDALETIKEVTSELDSKVQELNDYLKMLSELQDLNFPEHLQPAKESFSQSSILLSSRVTKISSKNKAQTRHILLSSGWLLLCDVGPLNKRNVQRAVSLTDGRVNGARRNSLTVCQDAKLSADYPNSLRLWTNGKSYDLKFDDEDEVKKWLEALRKLNLPMKETGYGDDDDELFPWRSVSVADLGRLEPAKIKDRDVSHCQACLISFTSVNRRHHCRLCGGLYCQRCSSYKADVEWSKWSSQRTCLFCKEHLCRRDGLPSELSPLHLGLIRNFELYRWDQISRWIIEQESAPILLEGYLNVRLKIPDLRKIRCPPELQSGWSRLWCSTDGRILRMKRGKLDRVTAHEILLLMEVKLEWTQPGKKIQLNVKEGKLESCSLMADPDSASCCSLADWFDCLKHSAEQLSSADRDGHGRQMSF